MNIRSMKSYLWVLKYFLQPQNVGKCLIRPILLQGVQLLIPRAWMQDLPALCLYCVCAASAYFIKYCILECWLYREMQFSFGVCMCGLVFFPHIPSCVRHNGSLTSKCHGIKEGTAVSLRPVLCWRNWL